jgi:hypothetical protein
MNFQEAVSRCPQLSDGLQPGLHALAAPHRGLVDIAEPRRLQHSLNLEALLSVNELRMKQWDYAFGWQSASGNDSCCFAEVHPANTTSATDIIGKKRDVESWLGRNAAEAWALARETALRLNAPVWHWLATDASIAIRRGSQAAKQLAASGISGPKRRLKLD